MGWTVQIEVLDAETTRPVRNASVWCGETLHQTTDEHGVTGWFPFADDVTWAVFRVDRHRYVSKLFPVYPHQAPTVSVDLTPAEEPTAVLAPTDLTVVSGSIDKVELAWKNPRTYSKILVRWNGDRQIEVPGGSTRAVVGGVFQEGVGYKFAVKGGSSYVTGVAYSAWTSISWTRPLAAPAPPLIDPATHQTAWRCCRRCRKLIWIGDSPVNSICWVAGLVGPVLYQFHSWSWDDSPFVVRHSYGPGGGYQAGWRYCRQCRGMTWSGDPSFNQCPAERQVLIPNPPAGAEGGHDFTGSLQYFVKIRGQVEPGALEQTGWRYCRRCRGLINQDAANKGMCTQGQSHELVLESEYQIRLE